MNLMFLVKCVGIGTGVFCIEELYEKHKKRSKQHKIEKAAKEKAEKEKEKAEKAEKEAIKKEFAEIVDYRKSKFFKCYPFSKITEVTLNNSNLTLENRSYMYDKLMARYNIIRHFSNIIYIGTYTATEIITNTYNSKLELLESSVTDFVNMYETLKNTDKDGLDSYILSFKNMDVIAAKNAEHNRKIAEEHEKANNELRIIEAKKQSEIDIINAKGKIESDRKQAEKESELEILKAKLDLEKSKFKTVMKTMSSAGDKNSSINLKTNVNLSGEEN